MMLAEYLVMFVFVAIMGFGLPGPGQASLIAAGALAGEGRLNVGVIGATALTALVFGSYVGYRIGVWKGRGLLDHPGPPLEKTRRKLLAKGDKAFGHGTVTFFASATMPSFLPGIFHVRLYTFMLVSTVASICWTIMYVGISYFFGAEIAHHIANTGTNAILGVVVLVAVGLGLRFGWSWWRARRQEQRTATLQDQAAAVPSEDKPALAPWPYCSLLSGAGPVRAGWVFLERN
jgi:membrane protein DedA with SNARE-associated domain